MKSLTVLQCFA
uniref:Uncharacterized protein n=1 Tax=Anguilla anguilla TaxID=7936 RepID=A0A0E9U3T7_ANGAN